VSDTQIVLQYNNLILYYIIIHNIKDFDNVSLTIYRLGTIIIQKSIPIHVSL